MSICGCVCTFNRKNFRPGNRFYFINTYTILLIFAVRVPEANRSHTIYELNCRMYVDAHREVELAVEWSGFHVRRYNLRGQGEFDFYERKGEKERETRGRGENNMMAIRVWHHHCHYLKHVSMATHRRTQTPKNSRASRPIRIH